MFRVFRIHDSDGVYQLQLEAEHYTVGRAKDNDIRLGVSTVSAHHAALVLKDDGYWLEDLLSTNGSYINGRRVQRKLLVDRDVIMLADCRIEYFEVLDTPGVKTKVYSGAIIDQDLQGPFDKRTQRMRHRRGESGDVPFRSGRFFQVNGKWFFSTREGQEIGPFDSLDRARAGLVEYARKVGFLVGFDDDMYGL